MVIENGKSWSFSLHEPTLNSLDIAKSIKNTNQLEGVYKSKCVKRVFARQFTKNHE